MLVGCKSFFVQAKGKHVHQMERPVGSLEMAGGVKQGSQEGGCWARVGHRAGCSLIQARSQSKQAHVFAGEFLGQGVQRCEGRLSQRTGKEVTLLLRKQVPGISDTSSFALYER